MLLRRRLVGFHARDQHLTTFGYRLQRVLVITTHNARTQTLLQTVENVRNGLFGLNLWPSAFLILADNSAPAIGVAHSPQSCCGPVGRRTLVLTRSQDIVASEGQLFALQGCLDNADLLRRPR